MADVPRQDLPLTDGEGRILRRGEYPEMTWPAIIVGWFLGAIIALSIGYAALILGFSIEGSELAAILGWGILRGIMGRTSIVENNINQTIASAVNGASAGMMFSVPALFILARQNPEKYAGVTEFSPLLMILACVTGGILGLAFVIPLRKQMIDFNRLAYPGGVAVAAILKSPGAGTQKAILLLAGAVLSAGAYLTAVASLGEHPELHVGDMIGAPTWANLTFFVSLMTIGVGFIAGRGGLVFGYGGFICYFLLAPLLIGFGSDEVKDIIFPVAAAAEAGNPIPADDQAAAMANVPNQLRMQLFRPTGIGMLIGAAIGGIIAAFPLIISAIRSMQDAAREKKETGQSSSDELPINLLYAGVLFGALALVIIAKFSITGMDWGRAGMMAILGTLWIWIAGVIVSECLGRTNWSPLSGMTLIAVTILILISSGLGDTGCIVSSVLVGAAICVAIAQAGDMMLDLKSGYLVGARPKMQQYGQVIGTWLGPILVMLLIFALDRSMELGSEKLPAPQGAALATVINAIVDENVPSWRYTAGAGLGGLLAFSGLGGVGVQIGLGFYMPFNIVLTYTIGCFSRIFADKYSGRKWVHDKGIPVAAGLIVGEALIGVGIAFYNILFGGA